MSRESQKQRGKKTSTEEWQAAGPKEASAKLKRVSGEQRKVDKGKPKCVGGSRAWDCPGCPNFACVMGMVSRWLVGSGHHQLEGRQVAHGP